MNSPSRWRAATGKQSLGVAHAGGAQGQGGGSPPPLLSLCESGIQAQRPEWIVLLARALASLLPGGAAGGDAWALGARRQRRSDPLTGSTLWALPRTGGELLSRHGSRRRGRREGRLAGHCHVSRQTDRQHGGRIPRFPASELGETNGIRRHSVWSRRRALAAVQDYNLRQGFRRGRRRIGTRTWGLPDDGDNGLLSPPHYFATVVPVLRRRPNHDLFCVFMEKHKILFVNLPISLQKDYLQ